MDKTKSEAWMKMATSLQTHGVIAIAASLAMAYREGLRDAARQSADTLITVHQPDGQIVTVKNPETVDG